MAEANGISPAAVCQWQRVPASRIEATAKALGLEPDVLRGIAAPAQQQNSA